ncbi:glycosyltransferase [Rhizobium sp. AQ_MP]|uniref:glycosyltransferase family 4 protein n=1 Tax=Rhizobium sp. AQ_MP TaxID=2761536 RepID=UPI00163A6B37|nr:glycosyltransferase family 4 protein [Rhizobium sp. AQ_MP]MBC2775488.1 glycosyltransferase [Rhizobium sp. AQ_MP]
MSLHLLFVTSLVAQANPSTGYELANGALLEGLERAGVRTTVVGCAWPGQAVAPGAHASLGEVEVRTEKAGSGLKLKWLLMSLASRLPMSSAKLRVIPEEAVRKAIASAGDFDGYILNGVALAGAFPHVFTGKPSIFVAHNVEHRSSAENARNAGSLIKRILFARDARLLKSLEDRLREQSAGVVAFAAEDLAELGGRPEASVFLPLSIARSTHLPVTTKLTHDLALLGTWTWHPNRIGLEWFLKEVKPMLLDDVRISVAGSTPDDLAVAWPDVKFVGRIDRAADFVAASAVIPLISRAGTGVQLKTIETFSLGLPSVATTSSVRGIATIPANCAIADDPADFAAALNDKIRRARGGDLQRLDGTMFADQQRIRMDAGIGAMLSLLTGKKSAQKETLS